MDCFWVLLVFLVNVYSCVVSCLGWMDVFIGCVLLFVRRLCCWVMIDFLVVLCLCVICFFWLVWGLDDGDWWCSVVCLGWGWLGISVIWLWFCGCVCLVFFSVCVLFWFCGSLLLFGLDVVCWVWWEWDECWCWVLWLYFMLWNFGNDILDCVCC